MHKGPEDDPTFGTPWAPGGEATKAWRDQSLPGMSSTKMSWEGEGSGGGDNGGGGGGCALAGLAALGGLTALGVAAKLVAAKYGVL